MSDLRALDREVAEKVMGVTVERKEFAFAGIGYRITTTHPAFFQHSEAEAWSRCAAYSSDPSAMMEVVEKMREKGWSVGMSTVLSVTPPLREQWRATFMRERDAVMDRESAMADALPEAVCRAALAAVSSMEQGRVEEPQGRA